MPVSTTPERIHHPDPASVDLATILRTVGDPLRLEIVRLLGEREQTCGELTEQLGIPASTGSYHLRQMREAGITRARGNGTQRMISVRSEELESRFPGIVALLTRTTAER
jgi:DNA-binding transcriptional ArsR family regulator